MTLPTQNETGGLRGFDASTPSKSRTRPCRNTSGCKNRPDGRIWFPCPLGVVMIDPAHIPVNRFAPPVHIDRIRANGKENRRTIMRFVPPGRAN